MSSSKGGGASAVPAVDRINAELLTLTYGALVRHLLLDLEAVSEVNKQLDDMGYRMGVRLIDDFLAKTSTQRCRNLREAARVVAEVALKMYLGVSAQVVGWNADGTECSLVMRENPLVDFVELPEDGKLKDLSYCNLICGWCVSLRCECECEAAASARPPTHTPRHPHSNSIHSSIGSRSPN